jgi:hypothetical protein
MKHHPVFPSLFVSSICRKNIEGGHSHNPWPYAGNHCCSRCNQKKVIRARMALIYLKASAPELKDEPVATPKESSK